MAGCAAIPKTAPTQEARETRDFATERSFTAPATQWPEQDWWHGAVGTSLVNTVAQTPRRYECRTLTLARLEPPASNAVTHT